MLSYLLPGGQSLPRMGFTNNGKIFLLWKQILFFTSWSRIKFGRRQNENDSCFPESAPIYLKLIVC